MERKIRKNNTGKYEEKEREDFDDAFPFGAGIRKGSRTACASLAQDVFEHVGCPDRGGGAGCAGCYDVGSCAADLRQQHDADTE